MRVGQEPVAHQHPTPILADNGLVDRVGPATNSGLYDTTVKRRAALRHRDSYRNQDVDFDRLVEEESA